MILFLHGIAKRPTKIIVKLLFFVSMLNTVQHSRLATFRTVQGVYIYIYIYIRPSKRLQPPPLMITLKA